MTEIVTNASISERSKFFRVLIRRKTVLFGLIVLAIFVILAVFAPLITPY
ncbi:MAG TPA: ABC transporter permease, partial [Phyllobacterium sp.]|nr:ABC transporter permease [Phyllobacterium sp.]